jgi:predicted ATPase
MLGPVEVRADDGRPVEITGARLRTLLILLALDPGRVVTNAQLIDGVWGAGPPAEATNALQALVSRLRRALPEPVVESTPAGYRLAVPPDDVDLHRFERLAAQGRAELADDPAAAARTLRGALDLWRGPALADAADAAFTQAPLARLQELRLAALGDRIEADLVRHHGDLVAELESLVAEHPLHERFAALLMRALAQSGRTGDALAVFARLREALADELGADPSRDLTALHLSILQGDPSRQERPHTNLRAALTSFVGRDTDLTRVSAMVGASRLVTLTGPGGSGKTRLATEVARALLDRVRDVWLVELAPVSDGADLPQAVLSALGLRAQTLVVTGPVLGVPAETAAPADRLAAALSNRSMLLVLDNCEHLIGAAAALANRLLGECPRLRILATSREPLGITGETLWPVDPLPLPPARASRDVAMTYPSMRLLADRAAAVRPGFAVDDRTALHMIDICRALDGMPLAIELAAARLRTLSPEQVATRLDDRFRLLTGGSRLALPRHQTLRAVVDWSWELLDDAERTLLRRLAVFSGGATLAAAEQVCAGDDLAAEDVLDVLSSLVDKSLVVLTEDGRYRLLETIKAYGVERLAEAGELDAVRWAHVDHFGRLAATAEPYLRRAEQLDWLARLDEEGDNVNAALRTAIAAGDARTATWFYANVGWYWFLRGHKVEGGEIAAEVLALSGDGSEAIGSGTGATEHDLALAYGFGALFAIDALRDQDAALRWFTSAVERADRAERRDHPLLRLMRPLAEVLNSFGRAHEVPPDDAMDDLAGDPDPWVRGTALVMRAHASLNAGRRHDRAEADFRVGLAAYRELNERWGMSFSLCSLADLLAWRGQLDEAMEMYRDAVGLFSQLVVNEDLVGYRLRLAVILSRLGREDESLAELAQARRDADRAGLPDSLAAVAHASGDFARRRGDLGLAQAELMRARLIMEQMGSVAPQFRAVLDVSCGFLASAEGDHDAATSLHAGALDWALQSNDAPVIAHVLVGVADAVLSGGDARRAAELLGASVAVRGLPDLSSTDAERVAAATRAALGEEFTEWYTRGRQATIETVRELAGFTPAV